MVRPRLLPSEVPHGTYAGYDWHRRWGVPQCDPCRKANTDKKQNERNAKRAQEAKDKPRQEAWQRACGRLALKYPAEFREILAEEMKYVRVELPPEVEGEEDGAIAGDGEG